jgi:hypothetical protein
MITDGFKRQGEQPSRPILTERAKKFGVPAVCCRCSADPNETECILYAVDASGQLRPAGKSPRSEAGKYVPCG